MTYKKIANILSQPRMCIYISGGLANNDEYNEAYGFNRLVGADAAEGGNDNDEGKDGGYPMLDAGLVYGWYLADNVDATAPCDGNNKEDAEDTEAAVDVAGNEEGNPCRKSAVDKLVWVFKCINSSSLLTNLLPQ